ncbi:MAG: hypothetical protein IJW46_06105 [Clostridia bacterium]|nr:hypothetical protein [Clostridia bacterium]
MNVYKLADALGLTPLATPDVDREVTSCYTGDLLSWVMGRAAQDSVWVTIMTNINTVAVATLTDASMVIIAENAEISPDVVEKAREKGVNLYTSPKDAYSLCVAISAYL